MKKNAILIDDDPFVHEDVRYRLKGLPNLILSGAFLTVDEALAYLDAHGNVDVVLCDIMMPEKDGYEANRLLAGYCRMFIFLTQKPRHGAEIYKAATMVHYLRKPIDAAAVALLLAQLDQANKTSAETGNSTSFFFVHDRLSKNKVMVDAQDILMVEFAGKYGEVTVEGKSEKMLIHGSAASVAGKLKAAGWFIRINRQCIISARAIKVVDSELVVYFRAGGYAAVKRTYQSEFRSFMKRQGLG